MVRLGSNLPPPTAASDDADRVAELVRRVPLGGVLLFRGQWPHIADTLARLQSESRFPLLVGSDLERGAGQQIDGATTFPHAMALGAGSNPDAAARTLAQITAREARACGVHWTFAPVADVNTFDRNPIIGTRAFGTEPDLVARCVRAYVEAARSEGLLTTAKHFPGHGRTASDSHATLPVVEASRDALASVDLPPFRAAIDAGVDSVMTAHVAYPALDDTRAPATTSRPILTDLLRGSLGFDGLVVTDSLLMEGARTDATPGEQAAALLRAGVDVLLDPDDPEAVVDGLVAAVEAGALAEDRVCDAADRVWRLKKQVHNRWGMHAFAPTGDGDVGSEAARGAAVRLAQDAVTTLGTPPDARVRAARPAPDGDGLLVIRVTPRKPDASPASAPLRDAVAASFPQARYAAVDASTRPDVRRDLQAAAREARHLVVACAVEPAAWHAFGLTSDQEAFVQALVGDRTSDRPMILAALGSPSILHLVPDGAADRVVHLCTYSDVPDSQRALVDTLRRG